MADLDLTAAIEAGARALVAHDGQDWDDLGDIRVSTEVVRNSYREAAEVVLRAGAEVIAGQVRQATADQGADILRQILIEHGETSQWTKADGRVISLCECGHECIGDDAVDAMIALDRHIVQTWREAIARRAGDGDGTATTAVGHCGQHQEQP